MTRHQGKAKMQHDSRNTRIECAFLLYSEDRKWKLQFEDSSPKF